MDEILLKRLTTFASNILTLACTAKDLCTCRPWDSDKSEQSTVTAAKLQSVLNRFNSDLYHYFNTSTCPDADEVSKLTTSQLEGEEALAELQVRIQLDKDSKLPGSHPIENRSKLPELTLQKFKGDVLSWFPFWDQFNSNIGQRNLRDVDKLLYLKASLEGEAKNMIDGLETTNENYKIAVETLKARYGRREQVVDAHYSTLYKIKPAIKPEDYRKTFDEIDRHLRVLHSLGEDTNHNHLRFLIMEKFPEDVIYEVRLKAGTESIEKIRKELNNIISAREDARGFNDKIKGDGVKYTTEALHTKEIRANKFFTKAKHHFKRNDRRTQKPVPSTSAFAVVPRKRQYESRNNETDRRDKWKRKKLQCVFCQGDHFNDKCNVFKTVEERKKKLGDCCHSCLRRGHLKATCRNATNCAYCNQRGKHNRALCPYMPRLESKGESVKTLQAHSGSSTVLQTAVVNVTSLKGITMKYRILLDSGSQRSYVTKRVAEELNLDVEEENELLVFTFGAKKPQSINSQLVKFYVETTTNKTKLLFANVVPSITQGVSCPRQDSITSICNKQIILADDGSLSDQVDILIGNDYYYALMSTEKIKLQENLYLVNSEFGWIVSGKIEDTLDDELQVLTYFQSSYDTKLNDPDHPIDMGNVKCLWELESIGITDSPKFNQEEEAIKHFNETTTIKDNRYYVSWPWTDYPPDLQTNFGLAYGRLLGLIKRLDTETLKIYNQTIRNQLEKGIIELIPEENQVDHPVHYLAHHGISSPGKTLRIVYDASAKTNNSKSLNECLYCGPILLEDLTGLLIKFRSHKIGITADVEKAFLQMALHTKDRDVTRFLWIKDINKPVEESNILHYRFTRVPFGVISSPFLLNATIKHHLSNSNLNHIRELVNDIYVDNLVTGVDNLQEAMTLYKDTKLTFQQISMNIREWSSNSKEFMKHVPDTNEDEVLKTLGLNWNLNKDTLQLRIKDMNYACTKRGVLKSIASIYDPCGFAAPIILPAKLLLQSLWKDKCQWDTPLPEEVAINWKDILKDFELIKTICLPRNISKHKDCQLHCFTDSSTKAYAAVVYLVHNGNVKFVIGKTKLAPIKDQENLKIPRLELLGVLIGNRLLQYVAKYIKVNVKQQILWTDSQIVIDWFHSNKLLEPFVSRRIEEIKRNKTLIIKHISSELNPADVATRPMKTREDLERWLNGPTFLTLEPNSWPKGPVNNTSLFSREGLPNSITLETELHSAQELQDSRKESEALAFHNKDINLKEANEVQSQSDTLERVDKDIGMNSEVQEILNLQKQYFPNEVKGEKTHLVRNLGLFTDVDGVLRCKGRLIHSDLTYDAKHPILLPKDCDFSKNIIKKIHEDNYHVGVLHTLSIVRQKFWIPQGRAQVQKVISKCAQCVKHGGGPYALPDTPALPTERVRYESPFAYVGIDYFGPMVVKTDNGQEKRWICLFTCLVIRAIHLEIVKDMSTEECSLAFRRFIAIRGVPELMLSDNALQFKLLSELVTIPDLSEKGIKWKFIAQLAPWHGGVYERMVAVVKHCLKRTLQKHLLGDNQLLTIIKEVEAVVNTRPLTYVGTDLEHVLKPADFLTPGKCLNIENIMDNITTSTTSTKEQLIEAWKKGQTIIKEYKDMFINQYLLSLRERYSQCPKQPRVKIHDVPQVGDAVQIKSEAKNRNNWKVGRICELLHGADGMCRVAKVKVGDTIFTRSIGHLYPLETDIIQVSDDLPNDISEDNLTSNTSEVVIQKEVNVPAPMDEDLDQTSRDVTEDVIEDMDTRSTDVTYHSDSHGTCDMINESTDAKVTNENEDTNENESTNIQSEEQVHKRAAAIQAMEKIREWTRHLMTTLTL